MLGTPACQSVCAVICPDELGLKITLFAPVFRPKWIDLSLVSRYLLTNSFSIGHGQKTGWFFSLVPPCLCTYTKKCCVFSYYFLNFFLRICSFWGQCKTKVIVPNYESQPYASALQGGVMQVMHVPLFTTLIFLLFNISCARVQYHHHILICITIMILLLLLVSK